MIRPLPYESITDAEMYMILRLFAIGTKLSGYLAGRKRGGRFVQMLEDEWSNTFNVKHAIACNSATSGLLAAAVVAGCNSTGSAICPAMTMSATAAAPAFTGARIDFCDVDPDDFALNVPMAVASDCRAIFITNLFGHPGRLTLWRDIANTNGTLLIEDNSQSPFAMERGRYAGTIGHIGVFSLNVHKPLQCGEGGMIVTDDDELAMKLRNFINHGEVVGDQIGLNLRMPELCAAVAMAQLRRGRGIIAERVEQAEAILDAIGVIPFLRPPVVRADCTHVYYTIPFVIENSWRWAFCHSLQNEGIPIVQGYVPPLYRLPAFERFATSCPVAEDLHDRGLFYIENCAWTFAREQIKQIGDGFKRAAEKMK